MIDRLDIDRGDIVSEQHNLVGMDFMPVFVFQLLGLDQPGLQQASDERAGAGEGVKDMDALAAQRLPELGFQHLINRMDDEIDHLHRGINDAQPLGHLGEGIAEKLVVQFHDDALLGFRIVDTSRTALHGLIEAVQTVHLLVQPVFVQRG